ncbi:hypothetical protein ACWEN6_01160 [Sphaerisporangium sp. NPDC004334]
MNVRKSFRVLCGERLRELTVPHPFEINTFCASVSLARGKPLILTAAPMTPTADSCPYGLWVGFDHADHIYYEQNTSPLHQAAIILHEVSHMLLGHPSDVADLAEMLPDVDPAKVRHWLSRHTGLITPTAQELQAELFSTLILERATSTRSRSRWAG